MLSTQYNPKGASQCVFQLFSFTDNSLHYTIIFLFKFGLCWELTFDNKPGEVVLGGLPYIRYRSNANPYYLSQSDLVSLYFLCMFVCVGACGCVSACVWEGVYISVCLRACARACVRACVRAIGIQNRFSIDWRELFSESINKLMRFLTPRAGRQRKAVKQETARGKVESKDCIENVGR